MLCQFLVLAGKRFWFKYACTTKSSSRLSGGLCCCVSFWFWREISIFFVVEGNFDYDQKKKIQLSVGRKLAVFLLWREIFITTGKKNSSRLSGGCVSFWFWREIGNFFVVAGNFHYNRKEKKVPVVCLAGTRSITTGKKNLVVRLVGCAVVSVFGSGRK